MNAYEKLKIILHYNDNTFFKFAKQIIKDEELGKVTLPCSRAELMKTKSICESIEDSRKRKPSGSQAYNIKEFCSYCMILYYEVNNEDDLYNAYIKMQTEAIVPLHENETQINNNIFIEKSQEKRFCPVCGDVEKKECITIRNECYDFEINLCEKHFAELKEKINSFEEQ